MVNETKFSQSRLLGFFPLLNHKQLTTRADTTNVILSSLNQIHHQELQDPLGLKGFSIADWTIKKSFFIKTPQIS